jgi:thiamine pyrophosphokinase
VVVDDEGGKGVMEEKIMELLGGGEPFDAVVLANGEFPQGLVPRTVLTMTKRRVCCDGAVHTLLAEGVLPEAVVGDGDSVSIEDRERLGSRFHRVAEQDYNDLTKATRYLLEHGCGPRIAYLGATGRREDHTLGNISLMYYYAHEWGVNPMLITDYGYFVVGKGKQLFATHPGQQVSIFNINCKHLTGTGLRWQPYAFEQLWQGTLNEATSANITLTGDGYYMVFRNFALDEVNAGNV